ncbi:MAG: DUF1684 domain-containing protein [Runella sp.]
MLKNKFLQGLIALVVLGVIVYTFLGEETTVSTDEYTAQIEKERKDKDQFFKNSPQSPLLQKEGFKGLKYFPADQAYKVIASIEPYEKDDKEVKVPLTDGTTDTYQKLGFAVFTLKDTPCRLLVYQHSEGISILFRDGTTSKDTYGGGRYLDFKLSDIQNNRLTIDFNKAYQPYCAYNPTYACPIPPQENTLPVRVEAGEKY